ncbi:MAG: 30S ribosomal protein S20 [Desulfovibrio sp.]|nr:30S ribosomal protein S20 [Desulfovibrio sp.]
MANHKSAIKRHKQSLKRAARNRSLRTRVKNVLKDARAAIRGNVEEDTAKALSIAQSVLGKATTKGAIHWKTASRKISRLARAANAAK